MKIQEYKDRKALDQQACNHSLPSAGNRRPANAQNREICRNLNETFSLFY
jgi:hypothetical protein